MKIYPLKALAIVSLLIVTPFESRAAESSVEHLHKVVALLKAEVDALRSAQIGVIEAFAGESIPEDYLPCDGRRVSRSMYPALFAKIGTLYGGSADTFALPDLRGQFIRGWSSMGGQAGNSPDGDRRLGSTQPFATSSQGVSATTSLDSPAPLVAHDSVHWYDVNSGGRKWSQGSGIGIPSIYGGNLANDGHPYPWGGSTPNLTQDKGRHISFYIRGGQWSTHLQGANETRPSNVAVQFIIRAR